MKQHAVVYIPGLGDHRVAGQTLAVRLWRLQGVAPQLFQMNWADGEPFDAKLKRLLAVVDQLHQEGKVVSLVAASAGASAALHVLAQRPEVINGVVSVCGKLSGLESVHPETYRRHTAFQDSMLGLTAAEAQLSARQRQRILSLRGLVDESVPAADTKLPGSVQRVMPTFTHFLSIAYGITVGSFGALRFLKRLAADHS